MAQRRMFSKTITSSSRFLKMPIDSQLLYFQLSMNADDDGVVEAYPIMTMIGSKEDNLKVLNTKGFVKVLNEDLVSYITDWTENNSIRADRKIDSIYKDLLLQIVPNAKLTESTSVSNIKGKMTSLSSSGQPNGNQMATNGCLSIGKGRVGKGRVGQGRAGQDRIATNVVTDDSRSSEVLETTIEENGIPSAGVNRLLGIFNNYTKGSLGKGSLNFGHKGYRRDAEKLIKLYGLEETCKMADQAIYSNLTNQYGPTITNPTELLNKLPQLKTSIAKTELERQRLKAKQDSNSCTV